MKIAASVGRWGVVFGFFGVVAGCGSDPVGPEFQVIEEVTFAASLNIDLASMEQLPNGVYRTDIVVGAGAEVAHGLNLTNTSTGWLADGSEFWSGTFSFLIGNNEVVRGFEDGILGMFVGGTRRIIIPPGLGYGGEAREGIPAGSILIFDVTADAVN